ncbi:hypothetical protein PV10_05560 [Exophiala mesophila]|uniref:Uncharacterized protein n=1 Tax=Exophiala mesophila TaxID=212818 RepID=A0A0D1Z8C1_EXOME|nr:uncharacterized protein PV10_05560 [Exophiala mesophila]KIV90962.1 hypothetical protein PV10_05560 [Exophiala mesophila]
MASQNAVGPQPNVQRMVQSVHTFADNFTEELARLQNVPAMAEGNAIQDDITRTLTSLDQIRAQIRTGLNQMGNRMDTSVAQMTQMNARMDMFAAAITQMNTRMDMFAVAITQMNAATTQMNGAINQMTSAITQVDAAITRMNIDMTASNNRMNRGLNEFTLRVKAIDRNTMARVQNSLLANPTDQLELLVDPSTNGPIRGHPKTPGDITTMKQATLTDVLLKFNLCHLGDRLAKENRLRLYIGLPPVTHP